jgi:hypothetical protein
MRQKHMYLVKKYNSSVSSEDLHAYSIRKLANEFCHINLNLIWVTRKGVT